MWMWGVAASITGALAYAFLVGRRARRRILSLDWPEKFQSWRKLRRYCRLFLKSRGWDVRTCARPMGAELIARKPPYEVAVQILLNQNFYAHMPWDFLQSSARRAERDKIPVALVTDFAVTENLRDTCQRRRVYPLHYKELRDLENLVPSKREFRKLSG